MSQEEIDDLLQGDFELNTIDDDIEEEIQFHSLSIKQQRDARSKNPLYQFLFKKPN